MTLKDGTLLFHGSYTAVEAIQLDRCASGKDFGRGFYVTSDVNQARSFIGTSLKKAKNFLDVPVTQNYGYVTSFRYHPDSNDIRIYVFDHADRNWLWFVSQNRRDRLAGVLRNKIDPAVFDADIVIGKIANDTTNPVITAYLNGLYGDVQSNEAIDFAIRQLMPDHLADQYCFHTQKAIHCLKFQEARKYVI